MHLLKESLVRGVVGFALLSGPAGYGVSCSVEVEGVGGILAKAWIHRSSFPKGRSRADSSVLKGAAAL